MRFLVRVVWGSHSSHNLSPPTGAGKHLRNMQYMLFTGHEVCVLQHMTRLTCANVYNGKLILLLNHDDKVNTCSTNGVQLKCSLYRVLLCQKIGN